MDATNARRRPREDDRRDDEHPGGVAEGPGPEDAPELVGGDHVAEAQRERPERRADQRRHQRAGHEGDHVRDPLEPAPAIGQPPQEQRPDDHGERVPDRLREDRAERRRVVAEEEVADDDRGPQPDSVEEQDCQAESRRWPQRGDRAVEVGKLEPDAAGQVVRERDDGERRGVAAGIRSADGTNAHGALAPSLIAAEPRGAAQSSRCGARRRRRACAGSCGRRVRRSRPRRRGRRARRTADRASRRRGRGSGRLRRAPRGRRAQRTGDAPDPEVPSVSRVHTNAPSGTAAKRLIRASSVSPMPTNPCARPCSAPTPRGASCARAWIGARKTGSMAAGR